MIRAARSSFITRLRAALGIAAAVTLAGTAAQASVVYNAGFDRMVRDATSDDAAPLSNVPSANVPSAEVPSGARARGASSNPFPDHLIFASRADAVAWAKRMSPRFKAALGAKRFVVVDPAPGAQPGGQPGGQEDARYVDLQEYVHEAWAAYQVLFPAAVGALPEPPVVLVDTDDVNALVMPDLETKRIGHAVLVFTGLLNAIGGTANRRALMGIIAHELAHTVFRHLVARNQGFFSRFYRITPAGPLGFEAPSDPKLEAQLRRWWADANLAGDENFAELAQLPVTSSHPYSSLLMALQLISASELKSNAPECIGPLQPLLKSWLTGWDEFPGPAFDYEPVMGELKPIANLAQIASSLKSRLETCAGLPEIVRKRRPFSSYAEAPFHAPLDRAAKAYDAAPNAADGLLAAVAVVRADMTQVERAVDFPHLGWFTWEEQADDASAIVNFALTGDALPLSDALGQILDASKPDGATVAACHAMIARGEIPAPGMIEDAHHGICYRQSNLARMAQAIHERGFEALAADFLQRSLPPGGFAGAKLP